MPGSPKIGKINQVNTAWEEANGGFWDIGNVQFLDLSCGHIGCVCFVKIHHTVQFGGHSLICVLYLKCLLKIFKLDGNCNPFGRDAYPQNEALTPHSFHLQN